MIRIAIDAMGGDYAPLEIVKGAVEAAKEFPVTILLVGDEKELHSQLSKYKGTESISIVHASQVINMGDAPAAAVKQKKDSSINVAVKLVAAGRADAVISAGNTGALMAASLFGLGRIRGVERPAIATMFPTTGKPVLLLDMGANVDCKPKHLKQFAEMGSAYAEHIMHTRNPRVGLLNIGEEPGKGNELTVESYKWLKEAKINFIGNVESKEIFSNKVDVIVCDGFVGNLILKLAESFGHTAVALLKKELFKSPLSILGAILLAKGLSNLKRTMEYDEYGAAPLLGIDGVCFKAHGRAKARAIRNAIRVTAEAVKERLVHYISMAESEAF